MKVVRYLSLVLFIVLLSGCNSNDKSAVNSYLSLMGESETWKVEQYKISITPESLKAGNGIFTMKNKTQYKSDYFDLEVHAVIDNDDTVIQTKEVIGSESDITEMTTEMLEGGTYLNKVGKAIELDNISNIYITIEWRDMNKGEKIKESIGLFNG